MIQTTAFSLTTSILLASTASYVPTEHQNEVLMDQFQEVLALAGKMSKHRLLVEQEHFGPAADMYW